MGDIIVSYDDDFFVFVLHEVLHQTIIKFQFVAQHLGAISSSSSVGEVDIDYDNIIKLDLRDSAICMKHGLLKYRTASVGEFSQNCGSCIAWPRSCMPTDIVSQIADFLWALMFKRFGLLQCDDIWIEQLYRITKSFIDNTSDTIDVSRQDFHGYKLYDCCDQSIKFLIV